MTKDSLVNFAQMAVLTCQRAQGDQNKVMRESWIRLCGTYQGKIGLLATPEMRAVNSSFIFHEKRFIFIGVPVLSQTLNEIATLYFAIPPPRTQAGNPFGDMMSSLFGGPAQSQPSRRMLAPGQAASTSPGLD